MALFIIKQSNVIQTTLPVGYQIVTYFEASSPVLWWRTPRERTAYVIVKGKMRYSRSRANLENLTTVFGMLILWRPSYAMHMAAEVCVITPYTEQLTQYQNTVSIDAWARLKRWKYKLSLVTVDSSQAQEWKSCHFEHDEHRCRNRRARVSERH